MSRFFPSSADWSARFLSGLLALACVGLLRAEDGDTAAPARDMASFEFLFARSPFSLPTAEESSPLADRYTLTGAAAWGGEQRVFVLDRTSQQRHVVSAGKGPGDMLLLEFLPEADPRKMRARVQIGDQVATIAFAEPPQAVVPNQPQNGQPMPAAPGSPQPGVPPPVISGGTNPNQPVRRSIIRRRPVTGVPAPTQ